MRPLVYVALPIFVWALLLLSVTACAHPEPRVVTVVKEVQTPILSRCVVEVAAQPVFAADEVSLDSSSVFDLVRALLVDREQRKARELELAAAVEGCR